MYNFILTEKFPQAGFISKILLTWTKSIPQNQKVKYANEDIGGKRKPLDLESLEGESRQHNESSLIGRDGTWY